MKRRLFSALFASAPALALPVPAPLPQPAGLLNSTYAPSPLDILQRKKYNQYHEERNEICDSIFRLRQRSVAKEFNHNIDALKSVKPQHKAHMLVKWHQELEQREKTWIQLLAEKFDIKNESNDPRSAASPARW